MIRYLFLGLQYNNELEKEYLKLSKHGLSAASNEFQWNLCDGFIQNSLTGQFEILTAIPVGCYPRHFKRSYIKHQVWEYNNIPVTELGCWNFPIIKQSSRTRDCFRYLTQWINKTPDDLHVIILYSLYLPYLKAIHRLRKSNLSFKSIIIVPDLPAQYGILPKNPLKARIAISIGKKAMRISEEFDGYVILTEQMKKPLKIAQKPYVVVEGICNDKQASIPDDVCNNQTKYFFYAGTLKREYGITNLLDAFDMINDSQVELWICGTGDTEREINDRASKNRRIRYLGFMPKKEIEILQQKSLALVNPRPNEGEYTKYSFPSKTMGYMASGKPVVMHKLAGILDEYDPYLIYAKDASASALADAMNQVLNMQEEERIAFGKKAQDFILSEKNPRIQAAKILTMINEKAYFNPFCD